MTKIIKTILFPTDYGTVELKYVKTDHLNRKEFEYDVPQSMYGERFISFKRKYEKQIEKFKSKCLSK